LQNQPHPRHQEASHEVVKERNGAGLEVGGPIAGRGPLAEEGLIAEKGLEVEEGGLQVGGGEGRGQEVDLQSSGDLKKMTRMASDFMSQI